MHFVKSAGGASVNTATDHDHVNEAKVQAKSAGPCFLCSGPHFKRQCPFNAAHRRRPPMRRGRGSGFQYGHYQQTNDFTPQHSNVQHYQPNDFTPQQSNVQHYQQSSDFTPQYSNLHNMGAQVLVIFLVGCFTIGPVLTSEVRDSGGMVVDVSFKIMAV